VSRNIDRYVRALRDQLAKLGLPQTVEDQFGEYRTELMHWLLRGRA
jgi:hypothetical protein